MKKNKLFLTILGLLMTAQFSFAQSGSTFTDSDTIPGLPYFGMGHTTCGYGDNYTTQDISCVGNFMSGDERIYSFTPSKTYTSAEVSITNISDNFSGLFIMSDSNVTGTCMGSLGNPTSNDRTVSNLQLTQGVTYYFIVSTWANPQCISSYDITVIDNACPAPSMLSSTGATKNDITLSWTENGAATQWVVEYGAIGFVPGAGTVVPAGTNPFVLTGLTSGTDYEWYVRADCGVDSSYAVGPEGFATLPDLCAGNLFYDNGGAFSNYANNSNDTTVICPNTTGDVVSLTFNQFSLESGYDYLKVYDGNTTSGTLLGNFSGTTIPGPFLATSTSGCLTIVFTSDGSVNRPGWEASVTCMPPPTCPAVDSLAVASLTGTTANLTWVEMGTATQWEIEYGGNGYTLGTGTRLLTTTNPVTISGLFASTVYDFYVRAVCGAADSSTWTGPYNFTTLCATSLSPFIDDVENHATTTNSTIANCWTSNPNGNIASFRWNVDGSGSTPSGSTGPSAAFSGSNYFYVEASSGSNGDVAELSSPLINVSTLTAPRLQFMYHMYGATTNKLVIEANDGTNWNVLDSIVGQQQTTAASAWLQHTIYLTGYTGNVQIRFKGYRGTSYTGDICLDDIEVNETPSCPSPASLSATSITGSSASLAWVEAGTATQWEVEYGITGFAQGGGTTVTANANPYSLTGLSTSSTYDFYVRSVCGATSYSSWAGPFSFSTPCGVVTAPITESFDATGTPNCWSQTATTGGPWTTTGSPDYGAASVTDHTGNNGNFIWMDHSGGDAAVSLISNDVDISALTIPYLEFYYYTNNTNDASINDLYIESWNGTAWTAIDSISQNTGGWTSFGYVLTGHTFNTSTVRIRFRAESGGSTNDYYQDQVLDDVSFKNAPSCPAPTALLASSITASSASLSWVESGSATQWQIEYGNTGFTQGTGIDSLTSSNPKIINGLNSGTTFDFYVRAVCGAADSSTWVGPYSFTTVVTCPAPTNLTAVASAGGATFDWVEAGSATLWEYQYGTSGFALGSGSRDTTSVHPVSVSGLAATTGYDVYVRAICGAGDSSTWVGPVSFTTPCGVFTPRYSEAFVQWLPNCWTQASAGNIATGPSSTGFSNWRAGAALGNSIAINLYTTTRSEWALSPEFDLSGGTYQLKIDVAVTNWQNAAADAMGSDDSVRLAYTENGSTWTVIKSWTAADSLSNTLTSEIFQLTSTGTNVKFGILATDGPVNDIEDYDFHFSNFIIEIPPLCPEPIALNVTNLGSNSASLGWTEAGSATQWEVEYGASGFTLGTGMDSITTNNPFNASGLSSVASYDFYVRAICGAGDTSIWSGPIGFTTLCGAVASPYFDSVETHAATNNATIANCWTTSPAGTTGDTRWNVDASGSTTSSLTGPSGAYSGTNYFYLETSQGSTDDMAELLSPLIDVTSLTLPRLQFMYHMYGASTNKLVIEAYDGSTWNTLDSIVGEQHTSYNDPWKQYSLYLTGYTGNTQIRFKGYKGSSYTGDISLDDIQVNEAPTCPEPNALSVSNLGSTSVNVGWTEAGSSTQWDVEYGAAGFVLGSGIDSLTSNNPLSINGLTSMVSYDFYVRSICGAGDTSVWAGPFNFTTSPDFCGGDHFFDNGGATGNYANGSNETTVICANNAGDLVSVSFNSFDLENNFDFLSIYDGNSAAGVLLGTFTGTTLPGTFDATTASGCLTFVFTSDGSVTRAGWDATVTCNPPPTCRKPTNLSASSITASSAMTDWDELGSATTWHVEYGLAGFIQGTGMLDTTTVDSLMLTGLTSISDYEFYVRSSCSATDSSTWAGPFSFTTECAIINTFPFLETYDILSPTIGCWTNNQIAGNGDWSLYSGAAGGSITGPVASGYYAGFVSNFGTNSPITNLESPEFDLSSLVFPRMSFWYAQEENGTNQNYTRVLYRISSSDPWVELWSDSSNVDVWTQVVLDLPNPSTTYQVAFQGINNRGRRNVIDEFEVFDIDPKDLSVVNVDIVNPTECGLGTDSVRATIVNFGSQIQNTFDLGYTFDGVASTPVTVSTPIGILDTVIYTFASTVNFTTANSYELNAYTILVGDTINGNDTATKFVGKTPMISNFPYSEDYSNGPAGWIIDNNVNGSWEFGNPVKSTISGAASDSNAFAIGGLTGNYNSNEDGFVYSPCFDFSSLAKPQVQMSVWYESEYGWDGANLQYSTDGGSTWNVIGGLNTGENWYTDNSINGMNGQPAWSGRGTGFSPGSGGWITATHDVGFLSGVADIKFRVAFGSDGSFEDEGFAFDDFAIFEGPELGADTVLCSDESLILDPGAFDGYYWTDSSITPTNFVEANALVDGTYDIVVIVSGVGGYKMYDTINVIVEKPLILLGNDTVVCYGTSIALDAGAGFDTYTWSNSATTQTTISAPAPSGNTDYYVNAVTALGCEATDTISVNVNTQVVVDLGVDTTFFDSVKQATSYTLDAGPGFVSYLWSTSDTTQSIVVDSLNDGTISVTVTNTSGCEGTDEVIVNFVLGVNSSFEVSTLTMYPNPATDQITIDVTNFNALDVINVTIVDITGKIVMIEKLEGAGSSFNETYDVSSLATGTYFVQFEANGDVVTRQFVIK